MTSGTQSNYMTCMTSTAHPLLEFMEPRRTRVHNPNPRPYNRKPDCNRAIIDGAMAAARAERGSVRGSTKRQRTPEAEVPESVEQESEAQTDAEDSETEIAGMSMCPFYLSA